MDEFLIRWNFVRSETIEILNVLSDEQLQFKPAGEKWQPIYYQFACMARTQLVYAKAAKTGKMDFTYFASTELPKKSDNQTLAQLMELLEFSNQKWLESIATNSHNVEWPDGKKSMQLHISNLCEHERLHHGQLISYFTLAEIELPKSFKSNWAL